jgi:deoxyribodipyrimidine photolyase-related protein
MAGAFIASVLHLVLTAMRRYAAVLREKGFAVDYQRSASFAAGLAAHRTTYAPRAIIAAEPMTRVMRAHMRELDVQLLRHERFLFDYDEFRAWASDRSPLRMDMFYRMRRNASG